VLTVIERRPIISYIGWKWSVIIEVARLFRKLEIKLQNRVLTQDRGPTKRKEDQCNYLSNVPTSHITFSRKRLQVRHTLIIRMKHPWYTSFAFNARDLALRRTLPFPRRDEASPRSSPCCSPISFSSSNDVTSKVQAVKLKRDLENRRSRVSPPSMLMSGGGLPPWRSVVTRIHHIASPVPFFLR